MTNALTHIIIILALPVVVFLGGDWIMTKMSNRHVVEQVLSNYASERDQKPLNLRLGYNVRDVAKHWRPIADGTEDDALYAEQSYLELDLMFPLLYGTALAISLLMAWAIMGRPFSPIWIFSPVVVTLLADWIENLMQISQLHSFAERGEVALSSGMIGVASAATITKLLFFGGTSLFLVVLLVVATVRTLQSE